MNVLAHFLECCQPWFLPAPWRRAAPRGHIFRVPDDPAAVLAQLREDVSVDQLLDAGLVRQRAEDLRLHRTLRRAGSWLLPITDDRGEVCSLITRDGLLRHNWADLSAHLAYQLSGSIEPRLWLTASVDDAQALGALGMLACPLEALIRCPLSDLVALAGAAGLGPIADPVADIDWTNAPGKSQSFASEAGSAGYSQSLANSVWSEEWPGAEPQTIVVVARLAALAPCGLTQLSHCWAHLEILQSTYDLELSHMTVWQPDMRFFGKLQLLLRGGDRATAASMIERSVDVTGLPFDEVLRRQGNPESLVEVLARYANIPADPYDLGRVRDKLLIDQLLLREVIAPLVQDCRDRGPRHQVLALMVARALPALIGGPTQHTRRNLPSRAGGREYLDQARYVLSILRELGR